MSAVAPRLQLRWERRPGDHQFLCHYELVLPLRDTDIRRDDESEELVVKMGSGTNVQGPTPEGPTTPFRDGAHARWDSEHLKVPIYVIDLDGQHHQLKD
jgi:hypothetical protein